MADAKRSQVDRKQATRTALIDASIDVLVERGWSAATTVAVCERAGVSRGALMHHYDSLAHLMADALESLQRDFEPGDAPPQSLVGLIDRACAVTQHPRFKAVLEASMAAGNDPELGRLLGPVIMRAAKVLDPRDDNVAGPIRHSDARAFYLTAREALIGLAFGRATNGGEQLMHERTVIDSLRGQAAIIDRQMLQIDSS